MVEEANKQSSEKKESKKTGWFQQGSKSRKALPWLATIGIFATAFIPGVNIAAILIAGVISAGFANADRRKNNREEEKRESANRESDDSGKKKGDGKESTQENTRDNTPSQTSKLAHVLGGVALTVGLGILTGGIGIAIGAFLTAFMATEKGTQAVDWVFNKTHSVLDWSANKALDGGKWAVDKMRSSEKGEEVGKEVEEEGRKIGEKSTFYTPEQKQGEGTNKGGPGGPNETGHQQGGNQTNLTPKAQEQAKKEGETLVKASGEVATTKETNMGAAKPIVGPATEKLVERESSAGQEQGSGATR